MKKKTTHLKEIASALNLSINTVSRALRDCYDISQKTKMQVKEKAIELGYVPKTLSQYIKGDDNYLVGIIIHTLGNQYVNYVTEALINELTKLNYKTTVVFSEQDYVDERVFKQCLAQRIDSIITFVEPLENFATTASLNKVPVIYLNNPEKKLNISSIKIDNSTGSLLASNYMFNIHKNIKKYVYVSIDKVFDSRERYQLIKQHMESLYKEESLDFVYKDIDEIDTETIMEIVKNEYYGVFAFNDEVAYRFIHMLNKVVPNARKVLPKLHIIGWDAISTRVLGLSDLTSVAFDYNLVINNTIRLVRKTRENPKYTETVCIPTKLHIRVGR